MGGKQLGCGLEAWFPEERLYIIPQCPWLITGFFLCLFPPHNPRPCPNWLKSHLSQDVHFPGCLAGFRSRSFIVYPLAGDIMVHACCLGENIPSAPSKSVLVWKVSVRVPLLREDARAPMCDKAASPS